MDLTVICQVMKIFGSLSDPRGGKFIRTPAPLSFRSLPRHSRVRDRWIYRRVAVAAPSLDVLPVTSQISRTTMP